MPFDEIIFSTNMENLLLSINEAFRTVQILEVHDFVWHNSPEKENLIPSFLRGVESIISAAEEIFLSAEFPFNPYGLTYGLALRSLIDSIDVAMTCSENVFDDVSKRHLLLIKNSAKTLYDLNHYFRDGQILVRH